MRYILFLMLTVTLNAQILLNETFSDFVRTGDANITALWVLDSVYAASKSKSLVSDMVNAHTLTANNMSTNYADERQSGSPVYSGGEHIDFTAASQEWFSIADVNAADFEPGTGAYTVEAIIRYEGDFSTSSHQHPYFSKGSGNQLNDSYYYNLRAGSFYKGLLYRAGDGVDGADTAPASDLTSLLNDNDWHVVTIAHNIGGNIYIYVDRVLRNTIDASSITPVTGSSSSLKIGAVGGTVNDPVFWTDQDIAAIRYSGIVRDSISVAEFGYLANGWNSLNGGVTRSFGEFVQGIANDTIYYNTALTDGSWTITLSDSAASGVNYEVLTSADAATWTTLATGTTGTSWGSKSYSGTGTGYVAIAVASGTAFFDNLVVSLAGGEKKKYNGYKGWIGY